jgi:hypothetical protein
LLNLQDSFQIAGSVPAPFYQMQNLLMQRRLQFQFESRLPIQPEFISTFLHAQHDPVRIDF